jgi:CBS domain-containing protein
MKVRDAMHEGVTWFQPTTPLPDIARAMRDEDIGCVPIGENDRLVGMVTDRDIICRGLAQRGDCLKMSARDVMSKPIVYCYEDEEVDDAIHVMEKHAVRRLPVISREKRMVGMLSLGDISLRAGRELAGEAIKATSAHHA